MPNKRRRRSRSANGRKWRETRAYVLRRDGGICMWCGAPATHADHLTPFSRGGSDDTSNLVAACQDCNLRRGNRLGPPPKPTIKRRRF